ncbi:hypothetical protein BDV95DRAFT_359219 [Massariosphaeria phaeospora]|uniref:Uncharacterized protein n=1 Tax=Massariosphaeria phaeospora TaxID=100035 RepID=A0A7C8M9M8_9PLEO|nr:hypothetical protein BDV95DRAFT_359219 [Massariosphaeria phaeospora]
MRRAAFVDPSPLQLPRLAWDGIKIDRHHVGDARRPFSRLPRYHSPTRKLQLLPQLQAKGDANTARCPPTPSTSNTACTPETTLSRSAPCSPRTTLEPAAVYCVETRAGRADGCGLVRPSITRGTGTISTPAGKQHFTTA